MAERASRRAVLTAAVTALPLFAAGCKGIAVLGPPPLPGPEVDTLDRAIRAERLLIARYHPLVVQPPAAAALAATLAEVYAEHQQHLRQLQFRLILPPRLATAPPATGPKPPPLQGNGTAAVPDELAAAERAAADRLTGELVTAPPALAQLMASIAASEAMHAVAIMNAGLR